MGCVGSRVDIEADGHQYHLKRLIASGGFSQIYSAEDLESGERVAIKKITCNSTAEVDRTHREIAFHRRFGGCCGPGTCFANENGNIMMHCEGDLDSPPYHHATKLRNGETPLLSPENEEKIRQQFLMPIVGVCEERISVAPSAPIVVFSLVFPLCKLGSLQDELTSRRPTKNYLCQKRIARLFRQVCSALEVLHTARPPIAHRDLKPANLLLRTEDHLLLTDFGSAVECPIPIEDARQRRLVLDEAAEFCTMPYRAPELFTCETGTVLDESVDIWSLGCVLYAMCFFCSPYDEVHERGDSVALAVQSARLKFDTDAPIGESVTSLISSLVKFTPTERPRISEILQRLEGLSRDSFVGKH